MNTFTKGYSGLLAGTGLAGIAFITLGSITKVPFWTAVGGALLGSTLGSFIGRAAKKDLSDEIKQIVRESTSVGMTSDDSKIAHFRREFHIYHITRMDGQYVWRHVVINFSDFSIPGRLLTKTTTTDADKQPVSYTLEGGVRDSRLVIFLKATIGDEPSGVYVFPFCGLGFTGDHFGMLFHQTFDATHSISPALITRKSIEGTEGIDTLPGSMNKTLEDKWNKLSKDTCAILPRVK